MTTPGSGSPRDVPGTPWLDCGTDRTVQGLSREWESSGCLGMSRGLPGWIVGQTGLSRDCPGGGSPRDVPGTPWLDCETDRTVGPLQGVGVLGMSWRLPGWTVRQTGLWDNSREWESSGCPGDSLAELNGKHYGHIYHDDDVIP